MSEEREGEGSRGKQPCSLTVHDMIWSSFSTQSNHPSRAPLKTFSAQTHCHCSRQRTHCFHSVAAARWEIGAQRHTLSLHLKKNSKDQNTFKLFLQPRYATIVSINYYCLQQFSIVWGKTPLHFYCIFFCPVWRCHKRVNVWSSTFSFHYKVKLHIAQIYWHGQGCIHHFNCDIL